MLAPTHPSSRNAMAEVFAAMAAQVPDDPGATADELVVWECQ